MVVYVEIHGIEPEDLEEDTGKGGDANDWNALANLIYDAIHGESRYNDDRREQLSHLDVEGVATVVNGDMHEKFTGRRPEYAKEGEN